MKKIFLLSQILFFNFIFSQSFDSIVKSNIELVDTFEKKNYCFYSIVNKSNIKKDEVSHEQDINIKSQNIPSLNRIILNCNKTYYFPTYYNLDKKNQTIILNKYNFIELENIFEFQKSNKQNLTSKTVFKNKSYFINEVKIDNVIVVNMKIKLGFYNKYSKNMHIVGNYDEILNISYLIYE
jgi:hypothetical protein